MSTSTSTSTISIYSTGEGCIEINTEARRGASNSLVDNLKKELNELQPSPGIVYRGMKYSRFQESLWISGTEMYFSDTGFLSTSQDRYEAETFALIEGSILLSIDSFTGVNISHYSAYPEQKEVLFLPGLYFKIINQGVTEVDGREIPFYTLKEMTLDKSVKLEPFCCPLPLEQLITYTPRRGTFFEVVRLCNDSKIAGYALPEPIK